MTNIWDEGCNWPYFIFCRQNQQQKKIDGFLWKLDKNDIELISSHNNADDDFIDGEEANSDDVSYLQSYIIVDKLNGLIGLLFSIA